MGRRANGSISPASAGAQAVAMKRLDHPLDGADELDHAQAEASLRVGRFGCHDFGEGFLAIGELAFQEVFLDERVFGGGRCETAAAQMAARIDEAVSTKKRCACELVLS